MGVLSALTIRQSRRPLKEQRLDNPSLKRRIITVDSGGNPNPTQPTK